MTSTLDRTLTDIMEDELYSPSQHGQHRVHQGQIQQVPLPQQGSPQVTPHQQEFPVFHHDTDKAFNEFANPNVYTHSNLPDDLYYYSSQSPSAPQVSRYDSFDDDVMLVPQDGLSDYPDILQFDLGGKQSNELNIFQVDVDEDLSDEEEEDDEMDLDDLSSDSDEEPPVSTSLPTLVSSVPAITSVDPSVFMKPLKRESPPLLDDDSDEEPVSFEMPDVANEAIKQRRDSGLKRPGTAPVAPVAPVVATTTSEGPEDSMMHVCSIVNPKTGAPCNKRFSRPYDLVRHQNTIHATKRLFYRCMFCEDDLRRKHHMPSNNEVVTDSHYRESEFSLENSNNNMANSHNSKKVKAQSQQGGYLSNKTFSRCDALTRHLRFRHGLDNDQVNDAMEYAKSHVEYYNN